MSGGKGKVPFVLRTNIGAGRGAAAQHSQSFHSFFMHMPGLKVVTPATPYDAKGLMNTALADENPVMFIEHKKLFITKGHVPEESYSIPFGKADIKREGNDITIVATHALVQKSLNVAEEMSREGINIEVLDPRTISPLDKEAILNSVKKTGKLVTADEGYVTGGFGSEVAAIVAQEAFDYLEAPIIRVGSPDTPVPFSPPLEQFYIPDEGNIKDAVSRILAYQ